MCGFLLALKRVSFLGLLLLGQSLDDLFLLGCKTLLSALTGLPGLGTASLGLVTKGRSEIEKRGSEGDTIAGHYTDYQVSFPGRP